MAISLSYFPILPLLLLICACISEAATVTYDFNITWVIANPDSAFNRATIGINGQWPIPTIRVTVGDTVIVNVDNQLGNQSTSLHFHGLYQNGTTDMDGPQGVSQCGISPGSKFTYNFTVNQPGTYWYHSHSRGQYPDGLRGLFIVHDPDSPYKGKFDEEIVLSVSDWYHEQMTKLIPGFIFKTNPTGAEPVPNAALLNETQNLGISLSPGKTYMFRMVNIGAFAGQYIWFENHTMTIVEVDGIYTEPQDAEMIYISAAQRYSFLLTAKNETNKNYAFVGSMDTDLFDVLPEGLQYNATGWLVYDGSKPMPEAASVDVLEGYNDVDLVPYDKEELYTNPDQSIELTVIMDNLGDGGNYAFFNNISYTTPKVPTLYTVLSAGTSAENPVVYGDYTHSFVLKKNEVVEIVVNNDDPGKHPFHLHGHAFQVVWRSESDEGFYNATATTEADFPKTPMRRDTVVINPNGNMVLRFKSDNPGVWLFHCHIEWHVNSGLVATMVEAPLDLQKTLVIPQGHIDACKAAGTPYQGNAAGNTKDFLDLTGQNKSPDPLPAGFTPRGIVALTFSILAALVGMAVIAWYGFADMGAASMESEKRRIAQADTASSAEIK